ncbi:LacI family DNA-binding transcriptional regulator [Boseongicola aestuarii]|uniref:DNA-binding transcriptional regulator GalS n=1 Tax=Boseongicola aestuarii TaxID=1470561 RepID=A0A238J471_9RHOB|nr:LacI family DNA-binding transcriptional regulator [Boseongicola aestuarii]SMX25022.1 DNA-binding transcriptional regulator GalS [Boseongicola aestuarii]
MTHRFPIKEIARQAGLGLATVDRVLNNREHVSPQTRLRVTAAIEELTAKEAQLPARSRRLFFDFVVEGPDHFNHEVKTAAEAVLPEIGTTICRIRFFQQKVMKEEEVVFTLKRILRRGSNGVCLKAWDTPKIREAVNTLSEARIPVATLVKDIPGTKRLCYRGLDNEGAGRTAAYLISKTVKDSAGTVVLTSSHERSLGEYQRETAFLTALADRSPQLRTVKLQAGSGSVSEMSRVMTNVLAAKPDLCAVYSIGASNRLILDTLEHNALRPSVFVAHDLDQENRDLILHQRLDFILHHDLQSDIKYTFDAFLSYHRLLTEPMDVPVSAVQVLTPENIPEQRPKDQAG